MKMQGLSGLAAIALSLVIVPASGSANELAPLSPHEVHAMYSGKTWMWDNGAGYFAPDGSFQAWTQDSEHGLMHASGRWSVEVGGQLCYSARWYYANTSSMSEDCFAHRNASGRILQRDETELGDWYVFNLHTLRNGNRVAARVPAFSVAGY